MRTLIIVGGDLNYCIEYCYNDHACIGFSFETQDGECILLDKITRAREKTTYSGGVRCSEWGSESVGTYDVHRFDIYPRNQGMLVYDWVGNLVGVKQILSWKKT